jgi:3-deoxy-7-phosphoheptulonate synthase
MIVVMRHGAPREQVEAVTRRIAADGLGLHVFEGEERFVIAVLGDPADDSLREAIEILPGVQDVSRTTRPYRLASREVRQDNSRVSVGSAVFGERLVLGAGAARLHHPDELVRLAEGAARAGAGLFWLGRPVDADLAHVLPMIASLRERTELPLLVEIWGPDEIDPLMTYCDGLLVGAQHLQSYPLIRALSRVRHPVVLARGPASTIEEWLLVADQLLQGGNFNVVLCEQGIRTYETAVRSTLDFSALAIVKRTSHLPVIANPSLASGRREFVAALALGAVGAGADGVLIDVHLGSGDEELAGPQALALEEFRALAEQIGRLGSALEAVRSA